ncbi:MAG: response regulator [Ferruginibacter sp.]
MALPRNMPIIYIEDDPDDRIIFAEILKEGSNIYPLRCFETGEKFLDYFRKTNDTPLLICCDINMPVMTGIELRKHILANKVLKDKNTPFIFFSTGPIPRQLETVNELNVQGHFLKIPNIHKLSSTVRMIIRYWSESIHSNGLMKSDEYLF